MANRKAYNTTDRRDQLLFIETKKGEFRGFKQDFLLTSLNEVEKEFYVCTKCNGLMRNACQIGEEQMLVCELCSNQGDKPLPTVKPRKKISELRTKCPLETRGCGWKGTIAEIETHLNTCTEFIIECTNKCDVIMKRSELRKHCMNECENREVNCQHCKAKMQYKELEKHYSICIEFPLKCPNECLKDLTRKEVKFHVQNECPNTVLNCTNKCGIKRIRCEMQNHCENECQNRNINCKHCKVIIVFKEIENHNKTCPEFPLLCPSECLKGLPRKELKAHIENDCPNTIIECPYKEMGCEETMKRRDVEEHEKIYELKHPRMTVQYFSNKTDQIEKNCKSQIDQNEKKCKSQIDQNEKKYKSQIDQNEKKYKSQIDQNEKKYKSKIDQMENNCKCQINQNEKKWISQIDQNEKKWISQIDQNEKKYKSQIDQMENNCKCQINQNKKKFKSQIDQNEKKCKSQLQTFELKIEYLETENEKLKRMLMEMMAFPEGKSYSVVFRDELHNEISKYLRNLLCYDELMFHRYKAPARTKIKHPVGSLFKEHFQKKSISDRTFENTMLYHSEGIEVDKVMIIYRNSFCYNQDQFYIQFEYEKNEPLIRVIILGQNHFGKGIAGTKFKLRILDSMNIHESLAFESIESPLSAGVYLVEIPKDLIVEERFRNENNSVPFIIQKQEMNNFP